jgi:hypothetical protein
VCRVLATFETSLRGMSKSFKQTMTVGSRPWSPESFTTVEQTDSSGLSLKKESYEYTVLLAIQYGTDPDHQCHRAIEARIP